MPPQGDERSIRRKADIPPVQQSSYIALRAMADLVIGHYGLAFVGRDACARPIRTRPVGAELEESRMYDHIGPRFRLAPCTIFALRQTSPCGGRGRPMAAPTEAVCTFNL